MSIRDLRPALRAFLLADASIVAMVGARVHPVRLPQGQKEPSVVYHRISALGDHNMAGPSGLSQVRMQVDCWAASSDTAAELSDLVKARLDGFRGPMPGSPPVEVQGIFFDNEREDFDAGMELYRMSRDYVVFFEEQ